MIEFAPVMMAEQLDVQGGETLEFADGGALNVDFIVFSTGIRPQDMLAKQCWLALSQRGGIAIDDRCRTSDAAIYAIGECAAWQGRIFGLVAL